MPIGGWSTASACRQARLRIARLPPAETLIHLERNAGRRFSGRRKLNPIAIDEGRSAHSSPSGSSRRLKPDGASPDHGDPVSKDQASIMLASNPAKRSRTVARPSSVRRPSKMLSQRLFERAFEVAQVRLRNKVAIMLTNEELAQAVGATKRNGKVLACTFPSLIDEADKRGYRRAFVIVNRYHLFPERRSSAPSLAQLFLPRRSVACSMSEANTFNHVPAKAGKQLPWSRDQQATSCEDR